MFITFICSLEGTSTIVNHSAALVPDSTITIFEKNTDKVKMWWQLSSIFLLVFAHSVSTHGLFFPVISLRAIVQTQAICFVCVTYFTFTYWTTSPSLHARQNMIMLTAGARSLLLKQAQVPPPHSSKALLWLLTFTQSHSGISLI